jgi:methylmalonyl-CoA mutase cobalamin-binding subunit
LNSKLAYVLGGGLCRPVVAQCVRHHGVSYVYGVSTPTKEAAQQMGRQLGATRVA